MISAIRKAIAKHRLAKTLAARKARRLPQQAEAKQRYWAGQRAMHKRDPLFGGGA